MMHKSARILETPKIEDWAKRTADICTDIIRGFNNIAYEDEPLEEYMVELVLTKIRHKLITWESEPMDSHLESEYADGQALASAGWGTDEDYNSGEML